jgi:SpoVK/Ycf46/Vps4 family AAA+-type ATPase
MVELFESSRQHLYAELRRLDLLIQREVWRWRQMNSPNPQVGDEFRGLYVSEAEVDAILHGVYPGSELVIDQAVGQDAERAFGQAIERAVQEIAQRKAASAERGIPLRLAQLQAMFDLTPLDVDALLICLAPEIDLRYERLYAYLQDDVTRKRPGVSLILNLLCATSDEQLTARMRFQPRAPLIEHQLVVLFDDPAMPHPPLLARYVKPDGRVAEFLLAENDQPCQGILDTRLSEFCTLAHGPVEHPDLSLDTLHLPSSTKAELARLAAQDSPLALLREPFGTHPPLGKTPTIVLLQGDHGTGKLDAARALCSAWSRPLLTVHLPRVVEQDKHFERTVHLAAREAYLSGAALYWHGHDVLLLKAATGDGDDERQVLRRDTLYDALLQYPVTSMLPVEDVEQQPDGALLRAPNLVRVHFPRPAYPLRCALWSTALEGCEMAADADEGVLAVAGRFRLTERQIAEAVRDAHHRATQRDPGRRAITTDDLFRAARARTSDQLRNQAKKIEPRHDWDDLVLPKDQVKQLHEMCDQIKYRHIVFDEWGFDGKLSMGKGLNALFAGPSGTGKTMAAEVIAGDLGLDLYKIDLSTVMSKYVGETEKNLERIFSAAHNSNAILFFDEADALFGKRSEVKDAHDRYANVEISYLLQKMEEYDGLVILTSNLSQNMDEAFVRRMHFTVEFPYPEEDARRRIWQIVFPEEAPLDAGVNLGLMAERFRLTGGNIRNVALTAAFLAARDGGTIGMEQLLWATRREYQKMGRLTDGREFVME